MPNPTSSLLRLADEGDQIRRLIPQVSPPRRSVIRAFHGSPYDFDRFDASKIGTGEGAQAYGYGLYFAGAEEVARQYRKMLARRSVQTPEGELPFPEWLSDSLLRENGLDYFRTHWRDTLIPAQAARGADISQLVKDLRAMDALAAGGKMRSTGRMYEVEIGYPESALLDWDRPLQSQSAFVGERLAPFRADKYDLDPRAGTDIETGATALHRIAAAFDDDMSEASAAFLKAGIPGIKYWDAGSRSAHKGTRNYVMFPGTEDSIRILRKFAVPGVVGTGAAAMSGEE